jgi:VRR-NUC domain-containing protein
MKPATESALVTACLQLLALRGVFAWRNNQGVIPSPDGRYRRFRGLRGVSDIIGVLADGRFLALEVKLPGGRLTPEQKAFIDAIQSRGGVAGVVRSMDELARVIDGCE